METTNWVWCPSCGYRDTSQTLTDLLQEAHKTPVCDGPLYQTPVLNDDAGALVTVEGIDGSGKSTLWRDLRGQFGDRDDFLFTREPSQDTWYGDAVYRSIRSDDADPLAELFLYMADHANHLRNVIQPALSDGKIVVCDRYIDSRCAYQAATLHDEYGDDILDYIYDLHTTISRFPDLTFQLTVPPEVGVERSEQANKFERVEHLELVDGFYHELRMRDRDRYVSLDTERLTPEETVDHAVTLLDLATDRGLV